MAGNYTSMHGCACGRPGEKVRREPWYDTRKWEVDIRHDDGKVHTNSITRDNEGFTQVLKSN